MNNSRAGSEMDKSIVSVNVTKSKMNSNTKKNISPIHSMGTMKIDNPSNLGKEFLT